LHRFLLIELGTPEGNPIRVSKPLD